MDLLDLEAWQVVVIYGLGCFVTYRLLYAGNRICPDSSHTPPTEEQIQNFCSVSCIFWPFTLPLTICLCLFVGVFSATDWISKTIDKKRETRKKMAPFSDDPGFRTDASTDPPYQSVNSRTNYLPPEVVKSGQPKHKITTSDIAALVFIVGVLALIFITAAVDLYDRGKKSGFAEFKAFHAKELAEEARLAQNQKLFDSILSGNSKVEIEKNREDAQYSSSVNIYLYVYKQGTEEIESKIPLCSVTQTDGVVVHTTKPGEIQ